MRKYTLLELERIRNTDGHQPGVKMCPVCQEDLSSVGINRLCITFDLCECPEADYPHVVEQVWHKACLTSYLIEHPDDQVCYRATRMEDSHGA